MSLEDFRADTRSWLEENCPASMRTPMSDEETVWGGKNATFVNPDAKLWLDRMGEKVGPALLGRENTAAAV